MHIHIKKFLKKVVEFIKSIITVVPESESEPQPTPTPTPTPVPNPTLTLDATERNFTYSAEEGKILKVYSNIEWTVFTSTSWITLKGTSGKGDGRVIYNISENSTTSTRKGTFTVSGSNISRVFTITQTAKASPAPTPTPDPTPSEDFTPPARTGSPKYTGSGKWNTFYDAGRSNEKSSKRVEISGWFKVKAWSGGGKEQPAGFCFASKGLVGSHWGLFLIIRPGGVAWGATKGEIGANHTVTLNVWHHVKAIATPTTVDLWLDGKKLKLNPKTFKGDNIRDSGEPLRIGGYYTNYSSATWFNQSLNGEISDWSVIMK